VAAGFFHCALGTQTVGSVIRPAAFCGITGFKPSYGRVSTKGVVAFSPTADHVGLFCRKPSEAGRLMAALTADWQAAAPPARIRLAIPAQRYLQQASADALAAFRLQVERLRAGGCEVVTVSLPEDVQGINDRHGRLIAAEMARQHAGWFDRYRDRYRPETRELIARGLDVSDAEMAALRPSFGRLRAQLEAVRAAEGLDGWISPAAVGEAPRGLVTTGSPLMNLPWTHAGLPAITLPAGQGPAGMPLGLQIAGAFMADEALLALTESLARLLF
jgi:Asp-tRNA(Asn)/Glu-tRNA(Gln) amidotransferase A subunit family amidase